MATESKTYEMKSAEIPIANANPPAIFVEDIRGVVVAAGVARLTLVENRVDVNTGQVQAYPVLTLIVPMEMVQNWGPFFLKQFGGTPEQSASAPGAMVGNDGEA